MAIEHESGIIEDSCHYRLLIFGAGYSTLISDGEGQPVCETELFLRYSVPPHSELPYVPTVKLGRFYILLTVRLGITSGR